MAPRLNTAILIVLSGFIGMFNWILLYALHPRLEFTIVDSNMKKEPERLEFTIKQYGKKEFVYEPESDFGYNPHPFLPSGFNETDDRIIKQLYGYIRGQKYQRRIKTIAVIGNNIKLGQTAFIERGCPVSDCSVIKFTEATRWSTADAVILKSALSPKQKLPHQVWILSLLESPIHTQRFNKLGNKINWTETYRRDSTIVSPYFKYQPYDHTIHAPPSLKKRNYASGKTKLVAWFVSNCNSYSGRLAYVQELQKFISIDIYGRCGPLKCKRGSDECHALLDNDYKFYLAFENSLCKDYMTEKYHIHGLERNIVPIVMGAAYMDYILASPPDSFIHVDNFTSPQHLADYIVFLDQNDHLYNNYFKWKSQGAFMDTKSICRICAMLHADLPNMWYSDVYKWWEGKNCRFSKEWSDMKKRKAALKKVDLGFSNFVLKS